MQARSSMGSDSRSCSRKVASPPVTVNFSFPGQHRSQRALSRAVRSHDGMHLAGLHLEVDALQYLFSGDLRP